MNIGQITRTSTLGNSIYELSKNEDIKNIVEIGTWSGCGSTKCVIDGLLERKNQEYNFTTIELYPEMYKIAQENLKDYINDKIKLLNGKIIEFDDIFWFDHRFLVIDEHAKLYYNTEMKYLKEGVNVAHH